MAGNPDELLRPREAAALLGISVHGLADRARRGVIPYYRQSDDPLHIGWHLYRRGDIELAAMRPLIKLIAQ